MGASVIIPAAIAAIGGFASYQQQKKAGKKADKIGQRNAERERAEAGEAGRRLELTQKQNLARARAGAGASGFDAGTGSTDSFGGYIDELGSQYEAELDWLRKSGASRATISEREGDLAKQTANAGAWGSLFEGVGQGAQWWAQS